MTGVQNVDWLPKSYKGVEIHRILMSESNYPLYNCVYHDGRTAQVCEGMGLRRTVNYEPEIVMVPPYNLSDIGRNEKPLPREEMIVSHAKDCIDAAIEINDHPQYCYVFQHEQNPDVVGICVLRYKAQEACWFSFGKLQY